MGHQRHLDEAEVGEQAVVCHGSDRDGVALALFIHEVNAGCEGHGLVRLE